MSVPRKSRPSDGREGNSDTDGDSQLLATNRRFYDPLWSDARLIEPRRFNTWPLVTTLATGSRRRLEVAPGLRPRLPLEDTHFVDISAPAVAKLRARGANAIQGRLSHLPFADGAFDFLCAFDIVEHVDDDQRALAELARLASPHAALILSVPLHPARWTPFDDLVGHRRRYRPRELLSKLAAHGLVVEQSAAYGMQPKSSRLLDLGTWFLTHQRERAMWWYVNIFMPLGLRFQKKLTPRPGLIETDDVDEILLICRKFPCDDTASSRQGK